MRKRMVSLSRMHRLVLFAPLLLLTRCTSGDRAAARTVDQRGAAAPGDSCLVVGAGRLPEAPEASGLVLSGRTPGILWTHNDTGRPLVIAYDTTGRFRGAVLVAGARAEDWEAIALTPCTGGPCLVVADIGDNRADRPEVVLYRFPEPLPGDSVTAPAEIFHATYPDGPADAEALLISPRGEVYLVTKGESGPAALYRLPPVSPGGTARLERIATIESGNVKRREMITDGTFSRDGQLVVLRTDRRMMVYPADRLLAGQVAPDREMDLSSLGEPQGEGIAVMPDGLVYLAGEGGGKGQPGTLALLRCGAPAEGDL